MNYGENMKRLLIIGASGHGKVVADIAKLVGEYKEIIFFDDNESIESVLGCIRKGKVKDIENENRNSDVFVAIGNVNTRVCLMKWISQLGFYMPILIHPSAIVAEDVIIKGSSVVMAGAIINSGAVIGKGVIVNTSSSIDHDCIVDDYVHISVGAHLAGTAHVGERTWIGVGATVSNNVDICRDVMVGAGAVVVRDITEPGTYVGVPAKKIK